MSRAATVQCPLGEKCPYKKGGKIPNHKTTSRTYRDHLAMSQGKMTMPGASSATDPSSDLDWKQSSVWNRKGRVSKQQWEADMREKAEVIKTVASDGIESVVLDRDKLDAFTSFIKSGYNYSLRNKILLAIQKPGSTMFRTKRQWEKMGYTVRADAKAATLLRPNIVKTNEIEKDAKGNPILDKDGNPKNKTIVLGYSAYEKVMGDKDLDPLGKEPPQHPLQEHFDRYKSRDDIEDSVPLREDLMSVAEQMGVSIEMKSPEDDRNILDGAAGYATKKDGKHVIVLSDAIADHAKTSTLAHELGHVLSGHLDGDSRNYGKRHDRGNMEFEAELFAYAVSREYGQDIGEGSFPYLKGWSNGSDEQKEQIENAVESSVNALSRYYEHLEKAVNGKSQVEEINDLYGGKYSR